MLKKFRDEWIAVLETPARPQAIDEWCNPETGGHCANGWLLQILIDRGLVAAHSDGLEWGLDSSWFAHGESRPSEAVRRITGLSHAHFETVMQLNDVRHLTLSEIAQWVRDNVPEEA